MAGALKAQGGTGGDLGWMLGAAVRWWIDELRALVPNALKARRGSAPAAFACVLFPDGRIAVAPLDRAAPVLPGAREAALPSEALVERVAAMAKGAGTRSVQLSVPASLCLVRRTRLPARALSQAGALLRHEIEGLLPLGPADILSDWYVETENPETRELDLVQVVLARPRIAAALEVLAAAGLGVTRIAVGDGEGRTMPVDLVGGREPSLRAFLARLPRRAQLMLALAAALFSAVPFLVAARQDAALEAGEAYRSAALRAGPAALSAQAVADALEAMARSPRASDILDAVAARLPPGAHLSRFQMSGGQVVLSVDGAEDAAVRTALSGMAGVAAVAPVEGLAGMTVLTLGTPPQPRIVGAAP